MTNSINAGLIPPPVVRESHWEKVKGREFTPEALALAPDFFIKALQQIPDEELESDEAQRYINILIKGGILQGDKAFKFLTESRETLGMKVMDIYLDALAKAPPPPGDLDTCKHFDKVSVLKFCNESRQFMIYGWTRTKWAEAVFAMTEIAKDRKFPLEKLFCWKAGLLEADIEECTTSEGRDIRQITYDTTKMDDKQKFSRPCKTALTDLVRENMLREKEDLPIIPCLFFYGIEGTPSNAAEKIGNRRSDISNLITSRELRRIWKLCHHKNPHIQRIARETFQFVNMKRIGQETYAVLPIDSPIIGNKELDESMLARQAKSKPKPDAVNWDVQLTQAANS